jgi:hypothetical protein
MPMVAGWIDQLRDAFGKEMIDLQIRRGLKGEGTFYARENNIEVGSKPPERKTT